MTDIRTTVPIAIRRRLALPRLRLPRLEIGALLAAMASLIGNATTLTYVAPYTDLRRRPQNVPDEDLEGRDPSW